MEKHCPENERIKREYLKFLKHARRRSEASLDMAAKAIDRFEAYARHRNFKEFRRQQAIGFCEHLAEQKNERNGNVLSRGTRHATLAALRSFFQCWPGSRATSHGSRIMMPTISAFPSGMDASPGRGWPRPIPCWSRSRP